MLKLNYLIEVALHFFGLHFQMKDTYTQPVYFDMH